jgi:hypothetical protein
MIALLRLLVFSLTLVCIPLFFLLASWGLPRSRISISKNIPGHVYKMMRRAVGTCSAAFFELTVFSSVILFKSFLFCVGLHRHPLFSLFL